MGSYDNYIPVEDIIDTSAASLKKLNDQLRYIRNKVMGGISNLDIEANSITAKEIKAGTITANEIDVGTLFVGTGGIRLDPTAVITWDQVEGTENVLTQTELVTALASYVTTGNMTQALANTLTTSNFSTIITKSYIATMNLVVGTEILMGANATISWLNVTNKPNNFAYTSDLVNYVTSGTLTSKLADLTTNSNLSTVLGTDYIVTGKIAANKIAAGTIAGCTLQTYSDPNNQVYLHEQFIECKYNGTANVKMGYWANGFPMLEFSNSAGTVSIYKSNSSFYISSDMTAGISTVPNIVLTKDTGSLALYAPNSIMANGSRILTQADPVTAKFA